jgi:hypothetical protein
MFNKFANKYDSKQIKDEFNLINEEAFNYYLI